jgi:DNA-directed RNA polymerase specialized sigma24 family protein
MVAEAMVDLPIDDREGFWLHDVEGLSNRETARAPGISVAAANSRVHRSRLGLRERSGRVRGERTVPATSPVSGERHRS